jgi:aspartate aminotransferase
VQILQRATITAVDADPSVLKHMVDAFTRRDLVVGLLKEIQE